MLRIGKLTDYAMLILTELAKTPDLHLSATLLSELVHIPAPTVSKILKMLSEAELVTSIRGVDGGYRLARAAQSISLAQVLAAMEGELAMTECCELNHSCVVTSVCALQHNWKKINKFVYVLLSKISIIDMLGPLTLQGLLDGK